LDPYYVSDLLLNAYVQLVYILQKIKLPQLIKVAKP
jgi:hypothetical protein